MKNNIFIITNSYPEDKISFNTDEFEYVVQNYDNFRILSFSKYKSNVNKNRVVLLDLASGIRQLFTLNTIKNIKRHMKIYRTIINNSVICALKNAYAYFIALSVIRKVKLQKGDLLYSYWLTRSSVIALYLNWLIDIEYICQGHGSDVYLNNNKITREILLFSKKIITISDTNKKYIETKYGIESDKISVFRLGVSKNFFDPTITKNTSRCNIIKFITVGKFGEIKGIDVLLKAIKLLVESDSKVENVEFNIYGGGKNYDLYCKYIDENNLQKYVNIYQWASKQKLYEAYINSDCYILSSRSEGLPVVLMEACSTCLPIIATNVGGVSEIVKDGINGILCEKENPNSIKNAICTFKTSSIEEKICMAKNSHYIYLKDYQLEDNLNAKYNFILREFRGN